MQIHKPYVLKALSHPLDRPDGPGRHTVGDVFGQQQSSKRRKRSELCAAIDGDAVHLYDIPSSQAVTAYLVSPQSFFTCAPYSLRWRPSSTRSTLRYTYVSIQDSVSSKREVKLFKDVVSEAGNTTSTTSSYSYRGNAPIVHISATSAKYSDSSLPGGDLPNHELVAVAADGTILGLSGETLEKKWQSSPQLLTQELPSGSKSEIQVDFVQSAQAADVIEGMFGGKNELFGVFQESIRRDGFNPDILILVTSVERPQGTWQRYLHVVALSVEKEPRQVNRQSVVPIFASPLSAKTEASKYQLDVRSGTLQELAGSVLSIYAFNSGIPRLETKLEVPGMTSFLRLSKTSILAATSSSLSVYNPLYHSLQASTLIELRDASQPQPGLSAENNDSSCELVAYLASRELAVGLRGTSLIAVQIEVPKSRSSKRRAEGLLTDAIRRGVAREQFCEKRNRAEHASSNVIADSLPGSLSDIYWVEWKSESANADELLHTNDMSGFEELLAGVFKIQTKGRDTKPNGIHPENDFAPVTEPESVSNLPEWAWPSSRADYPQVDRRWVFYAITRVFSWNSLTCDPETSQLACRLPESNVLNYLVDAGHLSLPNIKSAFQDDVRDEEDVDSILGEQLAPILVQVDPTMELLLGYLSGTQLGPTELVSAIKLLLRSLDLLEDPSKSKLLRIKENMEQEHDGNNDDVNIELDRAEEELQITEYYLDSDSSRRARGLSVAFSKLVVCPTLATVQSLRRQFKPEETICLMNVLRMELIKDGWTTRYLDRSQVDEDDVEAPPDGSIQLIADLMCRCIDSVGLGGWMAFDTMLANWGNQQDSADFFSQFQAEISVALEGVLEAVRLQGTLAEAVSYAKKARKAIADAGKNKVTAVQLTEELPLGLKIDSKISVERVRSGAEIVPRSRRQIGLFVSKKRRSYSVHRISEESMLSGSGNTIVHEAV
ncbi:hypothetical protein B0T24DRAFT_195788 [Lasiosphaeria ovina]|uniref:Uncharacterized protein n=1 Tax=Lasiosphaeria ovina TaxID=92902 RepID=A0AAE0NFC2_9PEZI|nr:hypothetical protein B0T24DRAFT_195788 [Lasiosphaeria ovina]